MLPTGIHFDSYGGEAALLKTPRARLAAALLVAALALLPLGSSAYLHGLGTQVHITLIAVLGLHVTVGMAGQINIAQSAFVGVGAFAAAKLSGLGWPFWGVIPAAALLTGAVGILFALPAARVKGFYLALTTLIPVTAPSNIFLAFVILVMAVLGWAQLSREVRSKTLSLARIEYVRAAVAVGSSDFRIITRHILPNVMSHIIVAITLAIPSVVLLESFLGFLGFAVKPPLISWGLMLQDTSTFSVIGSYPWILSPVVFVLITVFAFNALGDGLRDAVDPYQ